jgi:hypothetical protein
MITPIGLVGMNTRLRLYNCITLLLYLYTLLYTPQLTTMCRRPSLIA